MLAGWHVIYPDYSNNPGRPEEFVDLIEQAFLEGQIDGRKADLACWWLQANRYNLML